MNRETIPEVDEKGNYNEDNSTNSPTVISVWNHLSVYLPTLQTSWSTIQKKTFHRVDGFQKFSSCSKK